MENIRICRYWRVISAIFVRNLSEFTYFKFRSFINITEYMKIIPRKPTTIQHV